MECTSINYLLNDIIHQCVCSFLVWLAVSLLPLLYMLSLVQNASLIKKKKKKKTSSSLRE